MVDRLSVVLDVPLRYPLLLGGSTSFVLEHPAPLARRRCGAVRFGLGFLG